jgi:hypothetical protein
MWAASGEWHRAYIIQFRLPLRVGDDIAMKPNIVAYSRPSDGVEIWRLAKARLPY